MVHLGFSEGALFSGFAGDILVFITGSLSTGLEGFADGLNFDRVLGFLFAGLFLVEDFTFSGGLCSRDFVSLGMISAAGGRFNGGSFTGVLDCSEASGMLMTVVNWLETCLGGKVICS